MSDDRITRHQMLMGMAEVVALRSTCSRSQVGAVAAIESRSLASGYNGAPSGMPHCNHDCICKNLPTESLSFSWDPEGHASGCPAIEGCLLSVHAEANVIAYAARHGIQLLTSVLYTTMAPCYPCSKLIINAGIVEVVYSRAYRDSSGLHLLESAGVRVWQQGA